MENKTTMIEIDLIKVNDRIRKDFGNIDQLAQDIKENGLINPILVTPNYELIAGERRYRAIKSLGWKTIEVRVMSVRDALHKLKLEISENEYRKDFTFREKIEWSKMLEREYSKIAKENMSKGGKGDKILETFDRNKTIAQEVGFGNKETYRQAKFIYENADDDTLDDLDKGKATINGVYKKLKTKDKNVGCKSTKVNNNEYDLQIKIKQLEHEKEQKDREINSLNARLKIAEESKERYKAMASMFGGVSVGLDKAEYRKLAKVCHPDNGGSEELMNIISKLYKK